MIKLPDFKKSFEYENNFYFTSAPSRLGKALAHYELFKIANELDGAIVECGVFKGASLLRFATFQEQFGKKKRTIFGFDTFDKFPETNFHDDKDKRKKFIQSAGESSISKTQLLSVAKKKGLTVPIELIAGDVLRTVPAFVKAHPNFKVALLNLDTDIYEPAVTILKYLYPLIVNGGVLISDDYKVFRGETQAIDQYFKGKNVKIQKFNKLETPHYIIK